MVDWLILPVKSLAGGKTRLAPRLDAGSRHALNTLLLTQALDLAQAGPGLHHTLVVSRCAEALALAAGRGAQVLQEQEPHGLNQALAQAVAHLAAVAASGPHAAACLTVLSCDVPLATPAALADMRARCRQARGGIVLATDRAATGTNALCLPRALAGRFRFGFGPDSRNRHAREAARLGLQCEVIEAGPLAFDIDSHQDYLEWQGSLPAASTGDRRPS